MGSADLALSNCVASNAHVDGSRNGIYLHGRVGGARDRDVPRCAEQRFYLDHRAPHLDSVENFARPRDGDGREYAQDADRDGELDNGKGVSHLSFRQVGWLDSI